MLPSISLDIWSGGLAKFLGFRQLQLLASSSKALAQLLVPHAESSSVWMTCCANADSSHVRQMLVFAAKHGKTDYLQCLLRLLPTMPPASEHIHIIRLNVKGQDGNIVHFKIKKKLKLKKLMEFYCVRQSLQKNQIHFLFYGKLLRDSQTPNELEMEDDDVIDVIKVTDAMALLPTGWCNTSKCAERALSSSTWKRSLSSAVWEATLGRHTSAVSLLLAHGASANALAPWEPLRPWCRTEDGTLTMQAISQHDNDTVDVLLRAKANITEDVSKIGYLPLHVAAQFDNAGAVIMLLKAGANVNAVGRNEQTPLMEAIKKRSSRTSSAGTVLAHFAKENVENVHPQEKFMQSLHVERNLATVKALLQGGANVNQGCPMLRNNWGTGHGSTVSPLMKAIDMQVQLLCFLLGTCLLPHATCISDAVFMVHCWAGCRRDAGTNHWRSRRQCVLWSANQLSSDEGSQKEGPRRPPRSTAFRGPRDTRCVELRLSRIVGSTEKGGGEKVPG